MLYQFTPPPPSCPWLPPRRPCLQLRPAPRRPSAQKIEFSPPANPPKQYFRRKYRHIITTQNSPYLLAITPNTFIFSFCTP